MQNVNTIYPNSYLSQALPEKPFKSGIKDCLKSLSSDEAKVMLAFSFYDSSFNTIYVGDKKISKQVKIHRSTVNIIKNHVLKRKNLISVSNRGANRTCITKVNFNMLNNVDLVMYFMDEIRALGGIFAYHITRLLKISFKLIINRVLPSRIKNKGMAILSEFEYLFNNSRDLPESFQNLPVIERMCLGVFPLSAIEHAMDKFHSHPCKVKNRLSFLRYMALDYVKLHDLSTLLHLSNWLYMISLKYAVRTKDFKDIKNSIFNFKKKSMIGDSLLKSVTPKGGGCKRKKTPNMQKNPKERKLGFIGRNFMDFIKAECS